MRCAVLTGLVAAGQDASKAERSTLDNLERLEGLYAPWNKDAQQTGEQALHKRLIQKWKDTYGDPDDPETLRRIQRLGDKLRAAQAGKPRKPPR